MNEYITIDGRQYALDTAAQRGEARAAMAAAGMRSAAIAGGDGYRFGRTATMRLGRDGGNFRDEDEFYAWVEYVCAHIDAETGLDVTVETANERDVQADRYLADTQEERQILQDAMERLWERWCA